MPTAPRHLLPLPTTTATGSAQPLKMSAQPVSRKRTRVEPGHEGVPAEPEQDERLQQLQAEHASTRAKRKKVEWALDLSLIHI